LIPRPLVTKKRVGIGTRVSDLASVDRLGTPAEEGTYPIKTLGRVAIRP
jgi:hypothetical protein